MFDLKKSLIINLSALLFVIPFTFLAVVLLSFYFARKKQAGVYLLLKQQWGKSAAQKRDFNKISSLFYYNHEADGGAYFVDDQTAKDLDLEDLFAELDHTNSRIGQQFLYNMLRSPAESREGLFAFDAFIEKMVKDEKTRVKCQKQLNKLKQHEDYFVINFLFFEFPPAPGWIKYVPLLQVLFLLTLVISFVNPLAVLLLMAIFCLNFVLHYKTKDKFHSFYVALGRIGTLYNVAKKMLKLDLPDQAAIASTLNKCKKIIRKFWVFDLNNLYYSEMTKPLGVAIELIKIATLLEVKGTYKVCHQFKDYKDKFMAIYSYIGRIDAAIAIGSFRKSLPSYCIPEFRTDKKYLRFEEIRHPLIKNSAANDLFNTGDKSIFINGTNMSGKTTFIRTIGINVLLARSICTCLAKRAELSFFNVYTSIRIEDDVEGGISYYFQELLRLKELVQTAEDSEQESLFLIDEILKGTNIYDRTKIARSVLCFLNQSPKALTMVTSHDIDLADQLKGLFDFYFFTETVNDAGLKFDYKIRKGLSTERNAVKLLSILDFPDQIINELK